MEKVSIKYTERSVSVRWPCDNGEWTTYKCKWSINSAKEAKSFLEYLFDYNGQLDKFYSYEFVVEEDHDN